MLLFDSKYVRLFLLVAGGSFPFTIGRIEHGHAVRPDLCAVDNQINPRKYLGSFYTDSLVHDPIALKLLIDVIGKVSFVLGSLSTSGVVSGTAHYPHENGVAVII